MFANLDELKAAGRIDAYSVSVEKVSEALEAMKYDISAIEIIFNMFRLKPAEELFEEATIWDFRQSKNCRSCLERKN